jgi:uncharacterized protein (TIGR03067 family)
MSCNRAGYLVSLTLILSCVSRAHATDEAAKADLAKLQGEWTMVSGEQGGQPMPDAMVKTGQRVCKDDQTTVTIGGVLFMKAKITLDATKNPKTIDYQITGGTNAGKTQLGIYELADDNTVKFCFAAPGQDRPDAFETKPGDGRTLSVWTKREAK